LRDDRRLSVAMVLPRKMLVPVAPHSIEGRDVGALRREAEIADRDQTRAIGRIAQLGLRKFAAEIAESIKLLDIARLEAGLRPHPGAQAKLECAVALWVEPS